MITDLVCKKEEIKCKNIVNNTKMISLDSVTKQNIMKHNPDYLQIPGHLYKKLRNRRLQIWKKKPII